MKKNRVGLIVVLMAIGGIGSLIIMLCTPPKADDIHITVRQRDFGNLDFRMDCRAGYGKEIYSLAQLPQNIQDKLGAIIQTQLPAYFIDKLTFSKGVIFDRRNYQQDTTAGNKTVNFISYDLRFIFSDFERGIERYNVALDLNGDGGIDGINLPLKESAKKGIQFNIFTIYRYYRKSCYRMRPLSQAVELARKLSDMEGYKNDSCIVDLSFSKPSNTLLWEVSYFQGLWDGMESYRVYKIDAESLLIKESNNILRRYD
ncbi:MAG: hypothetical protein ACM3Q4_06790 [Acidobacteriota bacterium]